MVTQFRSLAIDYRLLLEVKNKQMEIIDLYHLIIIAIENKLELARAVQTERGKPYVILSLISDIYRNSFQQSPSLSQLSSSCQKFTQKTRKKIVLSASGSL